MADRTMNTEQNREEWLKSLKLGSEVVVRTGSSLPRLNCLLCEVIRIEPKRKAFWVSVPIYSTQWKFDHEGRLENFTMTPPTIEDMEEILHDQLMDQLESLILTRSGDLRNDIGLDKLKQIVPILRGK